MAAATTGRGLIDRLRKLGNAALRLAWSVSVLGINTPLALAASVASLTPAEGTDAADVLRTARILTGGQVLEFVHPLIATAVYQSLSAELRTELHGRAAWAILDSGRGPVPAARHLMEARPSGDPEVVAQLRAAAGMFMQAGAPADGAELSGARPPRAAARIGPRRAALRPGLLHPALRPRVHRRPPARRARPSRGSPRNCAPVSWCGSPKPWRTATT